MTAGRRGKGVPKRRRQPPHYKLPPVRLSEAQRFELVHRLWSARSTLLIVAAQSIALRPQALSAAKAVVETVDHLWPEPAGNSDDRRRGAGQISRRPAH